MPNNQKDQAQNKAQQQSQNRDSSQQSRNMDKKPASGEQIPNRNPQDQQRSR